jgi:hypothetical protein
LRRFWLLAVVAIAGLAAALAIGASSDSPEQQSKSASRAGLQAALVPAAVGSPPWLGELEDRLQAAPGAIAVVPDPLGGEEPSFEFTVDEGDVYPITPTGNPRAQALTPAVIEDGDEIWLMTKFMLPRDFPSVPGWMSLISIYGPPYGGASPWQIDIKNDEFRWQRNGTYAYDLPWKMPLVRGRWIDVLLHQRFATDGWVEMWIDGQRIEFFAPDDYNPGGHPSTNRLAMATMDSSNGGGPNSAKIMQYRQLGMFDSATIYFGALRVGSTRAAVES